MNPSLWFFNLCEIAKRSLSNSYRNSLQQWAEDPDAKNVQDEKEEEEKEKLEERDDELSLQKARAWDDWKDGKLDSGSQMQPDTVVVGN